MGDATGFSQQCSTDEQWFKQALQRQLIDLRRYDIPATVVTLTINPTLFTDVLLLVKCQIRGIDYLWDMPKNTEMKTICILLPLTGAIKAIEFVKRIDELMQQQYGIDVIDNSVRCETLELNGKSNADELIGSLGK